jgi:hypothetical protein
MVFCGKTALFTEVPLSHLSQVCSQLHRTHADFAPALIPALARVIPAAGALTGGEGGEPLSALSRRLKLRLLTELILVGVAPDAKELLGAVRDLVAVDYAKDKARRGSPRSYRFPPLFLTHPRRRRIDSPPPLFTTPTPF